MLAGMYLRVDIWEEDEQPLLEWAEQEGRSLKQQAGYLLHVKVRELVRLGQNDAAVAEQVA